MAREIVPLRLDEIGLDPRPHRQIRALDMAHIRHLIEDTDPAEWDPIQVRLWPENDPYPSGEEGRRWQVVSGYHRTTAARAMASMTTIMASVVDAPDDARFTLLALKGNLRHGKMMSSDEQRAAVVRLHTLGMSLGDIQRETTIPKGTIHNWLSQRDTNAGRMLRTQHADSKAINTQQSQNDDGDGDAFDAAWRVPPNPDTARGREVGSAISDLLATTYDPRDVLAWIAMLAPHAKESLLKDVDTLGQWLSNLRVALSMNATDEDASQGGAA